MSAERFVSSSLCMFFLGIAVGWLLCFVQYWTWTWLG